MATQIEDEHRLVPPLVEGALQRDVVAERLVHLLALEAEHPVVHPQARERMPQRTRLGNLVLVVRKDEVEAPAVDLELGAEVLLAHRRALDVPAGTAPAPRRLPPSVLARLVRLPEREVPRILLARVRLLLGHLIELLPAEPPVRGEARDAKVDVPLRLVGEVRGDQLLDQRDLV